MKAIYTYYLVLVPFLAVLAILPNLDVVQKAGLITVRTGFDVATHLATLAETLPD